MDSKILEALLFLKGKEGLKVSEIAKTLNQSQHLIKKLLNELEENLIKENSPLIIKNFEDNYFLTVSQEIGLELTKYLKRDIKIRLSTSAIETLTIIAYNQPVTKGFIEKIRSSSVDYTMFKLLEHNLIKDLGRDKTKQGNPRIYVTTNYFLKLFNLKSLSELPALKTDFKEQTEELDLLEFDDNLEKDYKLDIEKTREESITEKTIESSI